MPLRWHHRRRYELRTSLWLVPSGADLADVLERYDEAMEALGQADTDR